MIRKWLCVGVATAAMVALGAACKPGAKSGASNGGSPVKAASIAGFQTPESVKWDSTQDVYFVSNINGAPGAKDGNGYISRLGPAGKILDSAFIKGLNAPKGMALVHDTLWVADIDQVRAFQARTGVPVATVPMPGAIFLNDIAAAPDGSLYVTDTAIRFGANGQTEHTGTDQIFRIGPDRKVSVAIKSDSLGRPNGITWDPANQRFIVVTFGANKLLAWKPAETTTTTLGTGAGQFDGVEIAKDGAVWVTSWADSSIYRYAGGQGSNLVKGVPSPADIGYDARRNRLLVPILSGNRVEIWQLQ
jgi:SMP-30/Gluconolactonase/LRE-like region